MVVARNPKCFAGKPGNPGRETQDGIHRPLLIRQLGCFRRPCSVARRGCKLLLPDLPCHWSTTARREGANARVFKPWIKCAALGQPAQAERVFVDKSFVFNKHSAQVERTAFWKQAPPGPQTEAVPEPLPYPAGRVMPRRGIVKGPAPGPLRYLISPCMAALANSPEALSV